MRTVMGLVAVWLLWAPGPWPAHADLAGMPQPQQAHPTQDPPGESRAESQGFAGPHADSDTAEELPPVDAWPDTTGVGVALLGLLLLAAVWRAQRHPRVPR